MARQRGLRGGDFYPLLKMGGACNDAKHDACGLITVSEHDVGGDGGDYRRPAQALGRL